MPLMITFLLKLPFYCRITQFCSIYTLGGNHSDQTPNSNIVKNFRAAPGKLYGMKSNLRNFLDEYLLFFIRVTAVVFVVGRYD